MSKALSIDKGSGISNGFQRENPRIPKIEESAIISGSLLHKLGTSIPTPFARLHLFNSAFKEVNEAKQDNREIPGNYQILVSLALDMFEFLYLYGNSSDMEVLEWDMNRETQNLKNSTHKGHQELGEALSQAWKNGNYSGYVIYLFKFGENLIGGTSSLSGFYTNPNLTETFKGLSDNHELFSASPLGLEDRSEEFKRYMYMLRNTYTSEFNKDLALYIDSQFNEEVDAGTDLSKEINNFKGKDLSDRMAQMGEKFIRKNISQSKNELVTFSNGVELWVKDLSRTSFESDYYIDARHDKYSKYIEEGEEKTMQVPLVLNDNGINMAKYIDDTQWKSGLLPVIEGKKIQDRKLPGSEIKYPYLRAEDFFQNHIIELSYNIQKEKFFTGLDKFTTYLLPLKLEFFKYFTPQDLDSFFSLTPGEKDVLGNPQEIIASLSIPLKSGKHITLQKIYKREDGGIVDMRPGLNTFNLAFFPFFIDDAPSARNEFDVMLVNSASDVDLSFYSLEDPDFKYREGEIRKGNTEVVKTKRTEKIGKDGVGSTFYHIFKKFDAIEIKVTNEGKSAKGLVLPKFQRNINSSQPQADFAFGVDFGTTNTQISYSKNNGDIESFNISLKQENNRDELQTIFLNNHEIEKDQHVIDLGFGSFINALNFARREFISSEISPETFPIRTAVCEVSNLNTVNHPTLFGSLNIGFNYLNEMTGATNRLPYRHVTDLKWESSDGRYKDRITLFFQELIELMINKSLLNGGSRDIRLAVTYPQAMNERILKEFRESWNDACELAGLDPKRISFHYESIAPYYSFSRKHSLERTYVNMDIGGGSTDLLYVDNDTKERYILSVKFAGNDLWGDGNNPFYQGGNNAFIKEYEASSRFKNLDETTKTNYDNFKKNASSGGSVGNSQRSSDILNYLFKKDKEYHFSEVVKKSKLMLLPLIHFTSLIYYLAHIKESLTVEMPKELTFTGMGSLYLKMIGDEGPLGKVAGVILDHKTGKPNNSLKITFADNPKRVTAEGALTLSLGMADGKPVDIIRVEPINCYGINEEDSDTRITMEEVRNNIIKDHPKGSVPLSNLILEAYSDIAEMFTEDNLFRDTISKLGYEEALNALPSKQKLIDIFKNSFDITANNYKNEHQNSNDKERVKESLFFWPLKNGLFELGNEIIKEK